MRKSLQARRRERRPALTMELQTLPVGSARGGEQPRYKFLVLFSGTGSVEKLLHRLYPNCEIVTVDNDPSFHPTHCVDIENWADGSHSINNYTQYSKGEFDMIWASPPCTEYSMAKTTCARDLEGADARVRATLSIIENLEPAYWFIENPTSGNPIGLKYREVMKHLEPYAHDVTYCHYGRKFRKPTTIWTNTPNLQLKRCSAKTPCRYLKKASYHPETAQRGVNRLGRPGTSRTVAYSIPEQLLKALFKNMKLRKLPPVAKRSQTHSLFMTKVVEAPLQSCRTTGKDAHYVLPNKSDSHELLGRVTEYTLSQVQSQKAISHLLLNIGRDTTVSRAISYSNDNNDRLHVGNKSDREIRRVP